MQIGVRSVELGIRSCTIFYVIARSMVNAMRRGNLPEQREACMVQDGKTAGS